MFILNSGLNSCHMKHRFETRQSDVRKAMSTTTFIALKTTTAGAATASNEQNSKNIGASDFRIYLLHINHITCFLRQND